MEEEQSRERHEFDQKCYNRHQRLVFQRPTTQRHTWPPNLEDLRLGKHFDLFQRYGNQSRPGLKGPLNLIPRRSQHIEKSAIAAVSNRDMDDLRRRAQDQRAFVEVHILCEDHKVFRSPVLPDLRIGCCQKIELEKMFGFVTT